MSDITNPLRADAVVVLNDEANGDVSIEVRFPSDTPDLEKPSTWIAQFLILNWPSIVHATVKGRQATQNEEAVTDAVVKPTGLRLINPKGGFVK
jgi:hypothetical protein